MKKLVIATRGSRLALWQAEHIRSLLQEGHGTAAELLVLKTRGDIITDVPLAKVGGKGLFVKEIEEALLDGRADLAVHSMKDVPMVLPEGLFLGAIPPRESAEDLFISERFRGPEDLPPSARIGTSSLRRAAQMLAMRPDAIIHPLRGNVDTRLEKLKRGEFEAIIMASAGMTRLKLTSRYMLPLRPPLFIPAAGQGALGLEYRKDRVDLAELLSPLDHLPTRLCVTAERAFLTVLEGGCQAPIAAHASIDYSGPGSAPSPDSALDAPLTLIGLVANLDGSTILSKSRTGPARNALDLGRELAGEIESSGGKDILSRAYQQ